MESQKRYQLWQQASDQVYIRDLSYSIISETTSQATTDSSDTDLLKDDQESTNSEILHSNANIFEFRDSRSLSASEDGTK